MPNWTHGVLKPLTDDNKITARFRELISDCEPDYIDSEK
jgi:hypothetical protein